MTARRVALGGVLIALALCVSRVESLLPAPVPSVPGIKLGLANCVTLIVLYRWNVRAAAIVSVGRIALAAFMFSGLWGGAHALAGGIASLLIMCALKRSGAFSVTGVSAVGAVAHNLAQLALAALALGDSRLALVYYPTLIIAGLICGSVTAVIVGAFLRVRS
ncbi:MAG: Gx transporter family protein [Oscillospiraceae bacterium]|jgi:heptaprenyl diphosphate synthase|nr:Gx transporter family protein [Oscillospiraceae bacterium]